MLGVFERGLIRLQESGLCDRYLNAEQKFQCGVLSGADRDADDLDQLWRSDYRYSDRYNGMISAS